MASFQKPHLIGIGGIGVSAVARAFHALGKDVRGSDVRASSITQALQAEGLRVVIGQRKENLADADLVVVSTAIPPSNPERLAAEQRGIRCVHRSLALGALLREREAVGVLGTHGKGTVAGAIARILDLSGRQPSFLIGGLLNDYGTNTRFAKDGPVVAEIDESDGSMTAVPTPTVVINNLEADHLNYYRGGLADVLAQIEASLRLNPVLQRLVANADDPGARQVAERLGRPWVGFGFEHPLARYHGRNVREQGLSVAFEVWRDGARLGPVTLPLPGRYNAGNALAALTTACECGVPFDAAARALADYHGLENRFTVVAAGPVTVVKDYISHPTGIRRVLDAARALHAGPITAVFKPYRFTMIHYLQDDYAQAFCKAAHTVVTELYTAGEVPIAGIDTDFLCQRIRQSCQRVSYVHELDDIAPFLLREAPAGSLVIFFGGDDLFAVADTYARLAAEASS